MSRNVSISPRPALVDRALRTGQPHRARGTQGSGVPSAPPAREPDRIPIYILPARIQAGWGDIVEMSRACEWLAGPQTHLLHLRRKTCGRDQNFREDPRTVPIDPGTVDLPGFRDILEVDHPEGTGRAVVLVPWWGLTCRQKARGGPPRPKGIFFDTLTRIAEQHGRENVLVLSLEEFASNRDSRTARREALRQAGLPPDPRNATDGADWVRRYHRAFEAARGGRDPRVLHLFGAFAEDRSAGREFPFTVCIGPFGCPPASTIRRVTGPHRFIPPYRVVWYASPESSPEFLYRMLGDLRDAPERIDLWIRTGTLWGPERRPEAIPPRVRVRFLPWQSSQVWDHTLVGAHLVIVGGSQSLVDALAAGKPFLYFNGFSSGSAGDSRAYRREKLQNLLTAWKARGVSVRVRQDLLDFADARSPGKVLLRALRDPRWSREELRPLRTGPWPPWAIPEERRNGGAFLRKVVEDWKTYPGTLKDFVGKTRHRRASSC